MAQVQPFSVPQPSVGKYKKSQVNIIGKRGSPRDAANPSFFVDIFRTFLCPS